MTFEDWWMQLHPAEVDELKPVFEDCWKQAKRDGFMAGFMASGEGFNGEYGADYESEYFKKCMEEELK